MYKINKIKKNKGFTLVEILIATFIFMIIMLAAIGALVSVSNGAKKAKALRAAMDNVNYAMDNMSRSLRLGSLYHCNTSITILPPSPITSDCFGDSVIAFAPAHHTVNDTKFEFDRPTGQILKYSNGMPPISLTAPEVEVTDLAFYVTGSDISDISQPSIFMRVKGNVTVNGDVTTFALQNYISQRNLE
ncbi:prepilin-type N-terminal cleavage/methylation domain-containing protein [Candidatus Nomurabacteria bacterium]|nr:prepilin-type N-terminal cleavage/methylation domain-containing protein [Candidatus Nomurabacteria bacterium]